MKKKKKDKKPKTPVPLQQPSSYEADPLVEGDNKDFLKLRVFSYKNESIVYSYKEHFLYFPWENKKSTQYSTDCPPACFHLERRTDLKTFNFFQFRKDQTKVNLYRFARKHFLCYDLLEYITDDVESLARSKFQQQLTEIRESKIIDQVIKQNKIEPLFPQKSPLTGYNYKKLIFYNRKKSFEQMNNELDSFLNWYNTLNDELVNEVRPTKDYLNVIDIDTEPIDSESFLQDTNHMMLFNNNEFEIRKFISSLIRKYFTNSNTKFKIGIAGSPSIGKTYLRDMFQGYQITDLDDISMLDPNLGPQFHKLVNARKWNEQRELYKQVINTRFKEGVLLIQNEQQVPSWLPVITLITPGHLNKPKKWSDRGLFDAVKKSRYKIFIKDKRSRNVFLRIIFDEIYNSDNYNSS
jgi:hypothetical protein